MQKVTELFKDKVIYYSGSIKGVQESDPQLPSKIITFLQSQGAEVLSEHVAATSFEEMFKIVEKRSNKTAEELKKMSPQEWAFYIRKLDIEWVDKATHVVALVNGPSHGVGMELQRALDKPKMGLNSTPIICLIHEELQKNLSAMILGVTPEENPNYIVKTYRDFHDIELILQIYITQT
jgi:hypothetical protein